MKKQFIKDLPIYLNGFAVTMLLWGIPKITISDAIMFALAAITFFWYGKNTKPSSCISTSVCTCDKPDFVKDRFLGIEFCNKCAKDKNIEQY